MLAALLEAEQLHDSLSLMTDMHAQSLSLEPSSCEHMVMLFLMAGELEIALKVTLVRRALMDYCSTCALILHSVHACLCSPRISEKMKS